MFNDLLDVSNIPTLDLHGEYEVSSRIMVRDFIKENILLKNKYIAIIHGKGTGTVKKTVFDELKKNKDVEEYKLCYFNDGMTIVKLKK